MRPGQTDKSIAELAVLVNDVHQAHDEWERANADVDGMTLPPATLYDALGDLYDAFNLVEL